MNISIVIPNYNGLKLLKKHLPSVVRHSSGTQIIIIDDASTDSSVDWIRTAYPQIDIITNGDNLGFAASVNIGVSAAKHNLVLLLNNDVSLHQATIKHLKLHFQDPQVFGVGALEKLPGGRTRGKSTGSFQRGLLVHSRARSMSPGKTLWLFNASAMFNKKIWHRLGGLDPLYKPAYWEDIDLSYRAWKAGYICLFEPKAVVKHDTEATMNQVLGEAKAIYAYRNQLLFFWKNITDLDLIIYHLLWTPYHLIFTSIKSKGRFLIAFALALTRLSSLNNQAYSAPERLTDKAIIQTLSLQ